MGIAGLVSGSVYEIDDETDSFFANNDIDMLSVSQDDFKTAIAAAIEQGDDDV